MTPTLFAACALALVFSPYAVHAADYYLIGLDNNGQVNSSLSGAGDPHGWSLTDGGSTRDAKGMTSGNTYHVTTSSRGYVNMPCYENGQVVDGWISPEDAPIFVHSGAMLMIASRVWGRSGESAPFYRSATYRSISVESGATLRLYPANTGLNTTVNGNIELAEGALCEIGSAGSGSDTRVTTLAATVTGKGTISSYCAESVAGTYIVSANYITGDLSGFSGNLVLPANPYVSAQRRLWITGEKSCPADPAPGEEAYVAITNQLLVTTVDWISGTNRTWLLGNATISLNAHNMLAIMGAVKASSDLVKSGNGILVLGGAPQVSGKVTVYNGVVDVLDEGFAAGGTFNQAAVSSSGAAFHFPDAIEMPVRYLAATDGSGQSSMSGTSNCGGWATTSGGAKAESTAGFKKRYVVDGGKVLRPPAWINNDYFFGGNTLTVRNGVVVNVLGASGSDFAERRLTIYDLRVAENGFCKMQGASGINKAYGWGGNYMIGAGGELAFYGAPTATNNIYAAISGSGRLVFHVNALLNPPGKQEDFLFGDLSAFTGAIETYGPGTSARPTLGFSTARSFPGDCVAATADGLTVTNGARVAFAASGEIGPNRGILFGSGVRPVVDVAADETVTVYSAVSGTRGFEKTGTGTLALAGNLRRLSGTVKVSAGTLKLPHKLRCGTFTVEVAPGASVVYTQVGAGSVYYLR
ncbi:MAG: autotransporter-associated beta strand repeat-containing protein [Kiritimatiellae bacterium]|nr:autotransporter-associated beta strand repeat-containing protein [Kiritimatiellia bacterium]